MASAHAQVVHAIGEAELRGLLATTPNASAWATMLKEKCGIESPVELLQCEKGLLRRADKEYDGLEAIYVKCRDHATLKDASGAVMAKEDFCAKLGVVVASARVREPEFLKKLHGAVGLEGHSVGVLDEPGAWDGVAMQRGGRPLPIAERVNSKLLTAVMKGLCDPSGRRLISVDVRTMTVKHEKDEDDKKVKPVPVGRLTDNVWTAFRMLGAVGCHVIDPKAAGSPKILKDKDGMVTLGGAERQLDISFAECEDGAKALVKRIDEAWGMEEKVALFDAHWERMQRAVSATGEQLCLASAMRLAREVAQEQDATLALAMASISSRKGPGKGLGKGDRVPNPRPGGRKPPGGGKRGREGGDEEPSPKKAAKGKKPNSTGQICQTYKRTGKCKFGAKCIHRHLSDRDDDSSPDTRQAKKPEDGGEDAEAAE